MLVGTPDTGPFLRLSATVPLKSVVPLFGVDVLVRAKSAIVCLCNPEPFTIAISNVSSKMRTEE